MKAWNERYPHRVDCFANQEAFLEFMKACDHDPHLIVKSHHKHANIQNPDILTSITLAWAVQWANIGGEYLRLWTLLPNAQGSMEVHFATTKVDFWTTQPEFIQTTIGPFQFKIERKPA